MVEPQDSTDQAPAAAPTPSFGDAKGAALRVRRARPDDAALLHTLAAATFALACPPGTTAEAIADFIARNLSEESFVRYLSDPERELFVAEVGAAAAGYTMVVYGEPTDADAAASVTARPVAELSKCYVLERFHGTGAATALVEASASSARERGAAALWLGVNQHNDRANRFYGKNGFELVGTKTFLVGDKYEDDFVRVRGLTVD